MEPLVLVALAAAAAIGVGVHRVTTQDAALDPRAREERRAGLLLAQERLQSAVVSEKDGWASGRTGGFHVTYRLKQANTNRGPRRWTEIDVVLPAIPAALEVELRPHRAGVSKALITGDPFYDAFFLHVEPRLAGPELFDISFRKRLLDLHPLRVSHGSRGLRVEVEGWSQSPPRVKEVLALATAVGERVVQVSDRLPRMGTRSWKRFRRWYR